mmetsp:Transcript_39062/g.54273  ORF Transcript_39062/g.54273 Transcript_39062/m.54273 type:complete len:118 (+) Transcript_39062:308-661(+)
MRDKMTQLETQRREAQAQLRAKEAQLRSSGTAAQAGDLATRRVAELEMQQENHLREVSSLQKRLSSANEELAVARQSSLGQPEGEKSVRHLQGLLYSREKELRKAHQRIEVLQERVC